MSVTGEPVGRLPTLRSIPLIRDQPAGEDVLGYGSKLPGHFCRQAGRLAVQPDDPGRIPDRRLSAQPGQRRARQLP